MKQLKILFVMSVTLLGSYNQIKPSLWDVADVLLSPTPGGYGVGDAVGDALSSSHRSGRSRDAIQHDLRESHV